MTFSLLLPLVDAIPPCFSPSGRSSHSRRLDSNELVNRQWLSHCYSEPPKTDILQPKDEGDFRELRPQLKAECICILLTLLAIFAASYSSRSWLISPDLIQRTEAWRHSTPERVVELRPHVSGAPNVKFWKLSVRKTIWDLEFSEHLL